MMLKVTIAKHQRKQSILAEEYTKRSWGLQTHASTYVPGADLSLEGVQSAAAIQISVNSAVKQGMFYDFFYRPQNSKIIRSADFT